MVARDLQLSNGRLTRLKVTAASARIGRLWQGCEATLDRLQRVEAVQDRRKPLSSIHLDILIRHSGRKPGLF